MSHKMRLYDTLKRDVSSGCCLFIAFLLLLPLDVFFFVCVSLFCGVVLSDHLAKKKRVGCFTLIVL